MSMKDQAYRAHAALQASGIKSVTRSQVHELLAAAVGYASHAAFSATATWCNTPYKSTALTPVSGLVVSRCRDFGITSGEATLATEVLAAFQREAGLAPVAFEALIAALGGDERDPEWQDWIWTDIVEPARGQFEFYFQHQTELLAGLEAAAARGCIAAHVAIAKLLRDSAYRFGDEQERVKRQFRRAGVWMSPFVSFAEVASEPVRAEDKFRHHLFWAARAGDLRAMLDAADLYSDPAALDQRPSAAIDPMDMAYLAVEHEDFARERFWLTAAAREGNTDAMRQLILDHDEPLEQAWVWMHLSQALGDDLGQYHYALVHDNGEVYDDDVGGPGHIVGDGAIELEPLSHDLDVIAKAEAHDIFRTLSVDLDD